VKFRHSLSSSAVVYDENGNLAATSKMENGTMLASVAAPGVRYVINWISRIRIGPFRKPSKPLEVYDRSYKTLAKSRESVRSVR